MRSFRTVVFWMHLAAGVTAGIVILVMSVTGAALALKPQILAAVDARCEARRATDRRDAARRSQLTVDAMSGRVIAWEPYDGSSRGQKARLFVRFAHTGEIGGVSAQILAGLACLGGAFLVWTGLALAWRRLLGWRWRLDRVQGRVVQP